MCMKSVFLTFAMLHWCCVCITKIKERELTAGHKGKIFHRDIWRGLGDLSIYGREVLFTQDTGNYSIDCKQNWCKKIYHMNRVSWLNPWLYSNQSYTSVRDDHHSFWLWSRHANHLTKSLDCQPSSWQPT